MRKLIKKIFTKKSNSELVDLFRTEFPLDYKIAVERNENINSTYAKDFLKNHYPIA